MGLADLVRDSIALADSITDDLQPTVTHEAWIGTNEFAMPTYAMAVNRKAIVERKQKLVRVSSGQEILSQHVVSFLRPIAANGASGRNEPIDPRDRITLPDGTTAQILSVEGLVNRSTGAPFYAQVYLG